MSDPKPKRQPPTPLRFSEGHLAYLKALAGAAPLSTFIKSFLPHPDRPNRHGDSRSIDRPALARVLAVFSESRIAQHVAQLTDAAHSGSLVLTPEAERTLSEILAVLKDIRSILLQALGLRGER